MTIPDQDRPFYHYTPPSGWLNDPNGLVFYQGEYHLFYQHHPGDIVWGPMHWGHAVSRDLINWQHLPLALGPDEIGQIFSGSAVIDWRNTADFGKEAMVAIFTYHTHSGRQTQNLAFSLDRGRQWQKYEGNPVLESPEDIKDFRDPKVFWYPRGDNSGHWVMLLAAGDRVLIYISKDLFAWELASQFGQGNGATCGVWETPEIFELKVKGSKKTRWVLCVGIGDCAPAVGSGTQYFIGGFDGKTFYNDNPKETVLWADRGADFYAAQSWNEQPDERRIWIGWLNNWRYANKTPASIWRGTLSIPREVGLVETYDGIRMTQKPIHELEIQRANGHHWEDLRISADGGYIPEIQSGALELRAELTLDDRSAATRWGLLIRSGPDEWSTISYDISTRVLAFDRTRSGQVEFCDVFPAVHSARIESVNDRISLLVFVDRTVIEVFANDGLVVFTEQIFPISNIFSFEFFADGADVKISSLDIYDLNRARSNTVDEDAQLLSF